MFSRFISASIALAFTAMSTHGHSFTFRSAPEDPSNIRVFMDGATYLVEKPQGTLQVASDQDTLYFLHEDGLTLSLISDADLIEANGSSAVQPYDLRTILPAGFTARSLAAFQRDGLAYIYLGAERAGPVEESERFAVFPFLSGKVNPQNPESDLKRAAGMIGALKQAELAEQGDLGPLEQGFWVLTGEPITLAGNAQIALLKDPKTRQMALLNLDDQYNAVHKYAIDIASNPFQPVYKTAFSLDLYTLENAPEDDSFTITQESRFLDVSTDSYAFQIDSPSQTSPTPLSLITLQRQHATMAASARLEIVQQGLGNAWMRSFAAFQTLAPLVEALDRIAGNPDLSIEQIESEYPQLKTAMDEMNAVELVDWSREHGLIGAEEASDLRTETLIRSFRGGKWFAIATVAYIGLDTYFRGGFKVALTALHQHADGLNKALVSALDTVFAPVTSYTKKHAPKTHARLVGFRNALNRAIPNYRRFLVNNRNNLKYREGSHSDKVSDLTAKVLKKAGREAFDAKQLKKLSIEDLKKLQTKYGLAHAERIEVIKNQVRRANDINLQDFASKKPLPSFLKNMLSEDDYAKLNQLHQMGELSIKDFFQVRNPEEVLSQAKQAIEKNKRYLDKYEHVELLKRKAELRYTKELAKLETLLSEGSQAGKTGQKTFGKLSADLVEGSPVGKLSGLEFATDAQLYYKQGLIEHGGLPAIASDLQKIRQLLQKADGSVDDILNGFLEAERKTLAGFESAQEIATRNALLNARTLKSADLSAARKLAYNNNNVRLEDIRKFFNLSKAEIDAVKKGLGAQTDQEFIDFALRVLNTETAQLAGLSDDMIHARQILRAGEQRLKNLRKAIDSAKEWNPQGSYAETTHAPSSMTELLSKDATELNDLLSELQRVGARATAKTKVLRGVSGANETREAVRNVLAQAHLLDQKNSIEHLRALNDRSILQLSDKIPGEQLTAIESKLRQVSDIIAKVDDTNQKAIKNLKDLRNIKDSDELKRFFVKSGLYSEASLEEALKTSSLENLRVGKFKELVLNQGKKGLGLTKQDLAELKRLAEDLDRTMRNINQNINTVGSRDISRRINKLARSLDTAAMSTDDFMRVAAEHVDEQVKVIREVNGQTSSGTANPISQFMAGVANRYAWLGFSPEWVVSTARSTPHTPVGRFKKIFAQAILDSTGGAVPDGKGGMMQAAPKAEDVTRSLVALGGESIFDNAGVILITKDHENPIDRGWGDTPYHVKTPDWVPLIGGGGPSVGILGRWWNNAIGFTLRMPISYARGIPDRFIPLYEGSVKVSSKNVSILQSSLNGSLRGLHPMSMVKNQYLEYWIPFEANKQFFIARYKSNYADELETEEGQRAFKEFKETINARFDFASYGHNFLFNLTARKWFVNPQYRAVEFVKQYLDIAIPIAPLRWMARGLVENVMLPFGTASQPWHNELMGKHYPKMKILMANMGLQSVVNKIDEEGYTDYTSWTEREKQDFLQLVMLIEMQALDKQVPMPPASDEQAYAEWFALLQLRVFGMPQEIDTLKNAWEADPNDPMFKRVKVVQTEADRDGLTGAAMSSSEQGEEEVDQDMAAAKAKVAATEGLISFFQETYEHVRLLAAKGAPEPVAVERTEFTQADKLYGLKRMIHESYDLSDTIQRALGGMATNTDALGRWNLAAQTLVNVEAIALFSNWYGKPFNSWIVGNMVEKSKSLHDLLHGNKLYGKLTYLGTRGSQALKDAQAFLASKGQTHSQLFDKAKGVAARGKKIATSRQAAVAAVILSAAGFMYFDQQREAHVTSASVLAELLIDMQQLTMALTQALAAELTATQLDGAMTPQDLEEIRVFEQTVNERREQLGSALDEAYAATKDMIENKRHRYGNVYRWSGPVAMAMGGATWLGYTGMAKLARNWGGTNMPMGFRGYFSFLMKMGFIAFIAGSVAGENVDATIQNDTAMFLALHMAYTSAAVESETLRIIKEAVEAGEAVPENLSEVAFAAIESDTRSQGEDVLAFRSYLMCTANPQLQLCK